MKRYSPVLEKNTTHDLKIDTEAQIVSKEIKEDIDALPDDIKYIKIRTDLLQQRADSQKKYKSRCKNIDLSSNNRK